MSDPSIRSGARQPHARTLVPAALMLLAALSASPASAVSAPHRSAVAGQEQAPSGRTGGDWVRARFDAANTGVNPHESQLGLDNVWRLKKRWAFGTGKMIRSSPVVVAGLVYVGSNNGSLYALREGDGSLKWK